jgi:DNA-binding NarL/FixJ family response regulator
MPRRPRIPDRIAATIRVVMVEPRALLGAGVREVLDRESGIEVVAQVRSPDEALRIVDEAAPDVILVDVAPSEASAPSAARRLRRGTPETALVVLGGEDDDASIVDAVEIGAAGHITELANPTELVTTIRRVAQGDDLLKAKLAARPDLVGRIVDEVRRRIADDDTNANPLTARELDVLRLVAGGFRNREIAARLGISPQTVKNHLSAVLHKLGTRNRIRAATYAGRRGWLEPQDVALPMVDEGSHGAKGKRAT